MSAGIPGAVRRVIVGLDGPAVTISPEVAFVLAPVLRAWLNDERANGRRHDSPVETSVAAVEVLHDIHRHALMSGGGRASGHPLPPEHDEAALSVSETARALDLTERQVRRLIDSGDLIEVSRPGRMRWVDRASVIRAQRQRGTAA